MLKRSCHFKRKIIKTIFIIIKTKLAVEYFYLSDTDLFLVKKIKAFSRDFSEEKPLLMLRASQTIPVPLFTTVGHFLRKVTFSKVYYVFWTRPLRDHSNYGPDCFRTEIKNPDVCGTAYLKSNLYLSRIILCNILRVYSQFYIPCVYFSIECLVNCFGSKHASIKISSMSFIIPMTCYRL